MAALKTALEEAGKKITVEGVPMCSAAGANPNMANQLDIDQVEVKEMQLKGLLATLEDDETAAEKWLANASEKQYGISASYGPPVIPMPSYELYGQWLLDHEKPALAEKEFAKSLDKGPNRLRALTGQLNAAKMMENKERIAELEAAVQKVTARVEEKQS